MTISAVGKDSGKSQDAQRTQGDVAPAPRKAINVRNPEEDFGKIVNTNPGRGKVV